MASATIKFVQASQIALGATDGEMVRYYGTIVFSAAADTYPTGGLLPLAGFDLKSLGPYADRTPVVVYVTSRAGSGWDYIWANATGKLKIFGVGTGTTAVEVTNGTALSGLTPNVFTDDVVFEAVYARR